VDFEALKQKSDRLFELYHNNEVMAAEELNATQTAINCRENIKANNAEIKALQKDLKPLIGRVRKPKPEKPPRKTRSDKGKAKVQVQPKGAGGAGQPALHEQSAGQTDEIPGQEFDLK